jgi:phage shock protein A
MSGLSDTSAFEAFNRMAEKIEESERRSLAQAEVAEALSGDTLEQDFLRLEAGYGDSDVEGRLMALKQEMGLIAAPEGEKPKALAPGEEEEEEEEVDAELVDAEATPQEEEPPVADAQLLEEFERLEKDTHEA